MVSCGELQSGQLSQRTLSLYAVRFHWLTLWLFGELHFLSVIVNRWSLTTSLGNKLMLTSAVWVNRHADFLHHADSLRYKWVWWEPHGGSQEPKHNKETTIIGLIACLAFSPIPFCAFRVHSKSLVYLTAFPLLNNRLIDLLQAWPFCFLFLSIL